MKETSLGEVKGTPGGISPIIPANLQTGDAIPGMSRIYVYHVEGVMERNYAGVLRRVVYANGSISGYSMTGRYYWDQASGILLEIFGKQIQSNKVIEQYEMKATEDNIQEIAEFQTQLPLTLILLITLILFLVYRRKIRITC